MNIVKTIKQKLPYLGVSAALLLAAVAPGIISTQAFAAQVTERSIALSSSSFDADNVTYEVGFTAVQAAGAFTIDFCSEGTDPAEACTTPTGFSANVVTTATPDFSIGTKSAGKVIVIGDIDAADTVVVALDAINNPTAEGPLYARITTYAGESQANAGTPKLDQGSVAIQITNTISVSGAVLESLTFCVASATITQNCANASANAPVLKLGETVGTIKALQVGVVSTGLLYTQISTNATTGAVITLKSSTPCGGLQRVGAAICDIAPAQNLDIEGNDTTAKFGVKTGTAAATAGVTTATGTIQPAATSLYNSGSFVFNYAANNSTGVTSPLGDPFLDTDDKPADNQNMPLTFGATVTNSTPAGNYSTSLNMIATGKF